MNVHEDPLIYLLRTKNTQAKRSANYRESVLEQVCRALNSEVDPELKRRFRVWVAAWRRAGPDLKKLTQELPEIDSRSLRVPMRAVWKPTGGPQAALDFLPDYTALEISLGSDRVWATAPDGERIPGREIQALRLFYLFAFATCERVVVPCPRCERFFVTKRGSRTVYCSKKCRVVAKAAAWNQRKRKEQYRDKLERARSAARKWRASRTTEDWKTFVLRRQPDLTLNFLTRAVNEGELVAPVRQ